MSRIICIILLMTTYFNTYAFHDDILNQNNFATKFEKFNKARLIGLNKITAQSTEIILSINEQKYFGNIEIVMHKCLKNTDPYLLDSNVLLTIHEHKIDSDPSLVFQGWLSSYNISISTLQHPVYELFLKECF